MLRNVQYRLCQKVRCGFNRRLRQDKLRNDGVVSAISFLYVLLKPCNGIVILGDRSVLSLRRRLGCPSCLDNPDEDVAGFSDLRAQLSTRRQKPMHDWAESRRP